MSELTRSQVEDYRLGVPKKYPVVGGTTRRFLAAALIAAWDERDMLKTNDAMLRESLAWLADMASVLQERFASVSAVANIHPLSSNEWLDQALEHGFHEVEEAR